MAHFFFVKGTLACARQASRMSDIIELSSSAKLANLGTSHSPRKGIALCCRSLCMLLLEPAASGEPPRLLLVLSSEVVGVSVTTTAASRPSLCVLLSNPAMYASQFSHVPNFPFGSFMAPRPESGATIETRN